MRCSLHAVLLCVLPAFFFSLLYVFNQLASTLEAHDRWTPGKERRIPGGGAHSGGEKRHLKTRKNEKMHLAVVACGPRLEETLNMLKSAVLFSRRPLHFHIFAEDHLHKDFRDALNSWPHAVKLNFNFTNYPITFPSENAREWKKLFKPCASQRLFLPLILKKVDSLLYVDTDILFLQPVEEIWSFLSQFNSSHLAAMAPEHEEPRIAWYNRFARHPYYGKTGVNSGVMLMNMTRIREKLFKNDMTSVPLRWEEMLMPLLQKYKLNITWGDQDLLNIIFHHNPESLFVFPCQWNYRPDHCIYGSNCQPAEQEGVFILHGNRGVYHDDKQPAFRAVYEAVQKFPFGEDMETALLKPLEATLQTTTHTYCGRASRLFTKKLTQSIRVAQKDAGRDPNCPTEIEIMERTRPDEQSVSVSGTEDLKLPTLARRRTEMIAHSVLPHHR